VVPVPDKETDREVGFEQSKVDNCVFYKGKNMYVLCTDDLQNQIKQRIIRL
jgi:hypothetical protein